MIINIKHAQNLSNTFDFWSFYLEVAFPDALKCRQQQILLEHDLPQDAELLPLLHPPVSFTIL